jgi:hypothetical protein
MSHSPAIIPNPDSERVRAWRLKTPDKHKAYMEANRAAAAARAKAWAKSNPDRVKASRKRYSELHEYELRVRAKQWRAKNREKYNSQVASFYKKRPWYRSLQSAKNRCTNPNDIGYQYYGARGILFLLTQEEGERLWIRDNASALVKPSLDRINPDGNYTFDNCRFIEHRENCRLGGLSRAKRSDAKRNQ